MVTVTRAEVSGDLQHAKVYVSIMGTEKEQQLTLHGLRHAAGFVQSKLAKRLQTRFTPVVTFVLDQGVKNSIEMTRLINEALVPRQDAAGARRRTRTARRTPPTDAAPQTERRTRTRRNRDRTRDRRAGSDPAPVVPSSAIPNKE